MPYAFALSKLGFSQADVFQDFHLLHQILVFGNTKQNRGGFAVVRNHQRAPGLAGLADACGDIRAEFRQRLDVFVEVESRNRLFSFCALHCTIFCTVCQGPRYPKMSNMRPAMGRRVVRRLR